MIPSLADYRPIGRLRARVKTPIHEKVTRRLDPVDPPRVSAFRTGDDDRSRRYCA